MAYGVIYLITNIINGMKYFGQTKRLLKVRISEHKRGSLSLMSVSLKMREKYNFTVKDIAKLVEIFGKPAEYLMQRDDE